VHCTIYMYLYLYSYRGETARQLRMYAQLTRCFSAVAELLVINTKTLGNSSSYNNAAKRKGMYSGVPFPDLLGYIRTCLFRDVVLTQLCCLICIVSIESIQRSSSFISITVSAYRIMSNHIFYCERRCISTMFSPKDRSFTPSRK